METLHKKVKPGMLTLQKDIQDTILQLSWASFFAYLEEHSS